MKISASLALFFFCLYASPALAEFTVGLGYAVGVSPYKGYDKQHIALPWLQYENDYIYLRGASLGVKAYSRDLLELSAYLAYNPHSFKRKDSSDLRLKRLDNRDAGFMAGGRAVLNHPVGIFTAEMAGDISKRSEGFLGQFRYAKPFDLEPLTLIPSIGLYWGSEKYNDYYYGVSEKEAVRSGLAIYRPDASFSPFAALNADLSLDEDKRFGIFAASEAVFLPSSIKDSPMVDRSAIISFTTGLRYSFR